MTSKLVKAKAIIEFIDIYLINANSKSVDAVTANAILAKAGVLADSKDRPGLPLRKYLRDGLIPHAFQIGGAGSKWSIPLSIKKKSFIAKEPAKGPSTKELVSPKNVSKNQSSRLAPLKKKLLEEKYFRNASVVDAIIPDVPGLYCIRIKNIGAIPEPYKGELKKRNHNIFYIGIATTNLRRRFLNQELRATGHGTFFRSLGALLGFRPPKGSLVSKANKRNYKFSASDQVKIIDWINTNLTVNWIEFNGDFEFVESTLIAEHKPLINIAKNPVALPYLTKMRMECVRIANSV